MFGDEGAGQATGPVDHDRETLAAGTTRAVGPDITKLLATLSDAAAEALALVEAPRGHSDLELLALLDGPQEPR